MNKCNFNPKDSNEKLKEVISDFFLTIDDKKRELKVTRDEIFDTTYPDFIDLMKTVGSGYSIATISSVAEFIDEYIKDSFPRYTKFHNLPLESLLTGNKNTEVMNEEDKSKTDAVDEPDAENAGRYFIRELINLNYGTATEAAELLMQDITVNVTNHTMVNRETGTPINPNNLNNEIHLYQEYLLQNVVTYLLNSVYGKTKDSEDALNALKGLTMYDSDGNYTGAVEVINKYGHDYLHHSKFSSDQLKTIASRLSKPKNAKFISAYNSFVMLNNFDALFINSVSSFIESNPRFEVFSKDPKYYFIGTGAKNYTNWNDKDKDVDLNNQVSDSARLVIETSPMYSWNSATPIAHKYIKLDAFTFILSKIKNLVNLPSTHHILFDDVFFMKNPEFSDFREVLEGNTFYDILATASDDKALIKYSAIFALLSSDSFFNNYKTTFKGFYDIEKNIIYSAYKGLFSKDPIHSLYGIYSENTDLDIPNYYGYICQLVTTASSLNFMQYRINDEGELVRSSLRDNMNGQLRNLLEARISSKLSVITTEYKEMIQKYNPEFKEYSNTTSEKVWKFSFTIPETGITVLFNPRADKNVAFEYIRNGQAYLLSGNGEDTNLQDDFFNSLPFFKDFIDEDFKQYNPLVDNYLAITSTNGSIQYGSALKDLIEFGTSIFFNTYFSNILVPGKYPNTVSLDVFKNFLKQIFGNNNVPRVVKDAPEISIVGSKYISILDHITSAYAMSTGNYTSGIVRDGEGNPISGVGMSMLNASYQRQWVEQCKKENSITKDLSILNIETLHKGLVIAREFKGREGNKKYIDFDFSELIYSAFVKNYLCEMVKNVSQEADITKDSAMMPSTMSDKSQIAQIINNLHAVSNYSNKRFIDLEPSETKEIIAQEIGGVYFKMLTNILKSWNEVNKFITKYNKEHGTKYVKANPLTNFAKFNQTYGDNAGDTLEEILRLYQAAHPFSGTEIIDELSVINNGTLSFNRTIMSITNRFNPDKISDLYAKSGYKSIDNYFGDLTDVSTFWDTKEIELLTDLLDNNFVIETIDALGRVYATQEVKYLNGLTDWIKPSTGRVILAKLETTDGKMHDILNWNSFSQYTYKDDNDNTVHYQSKGYSIKELLKRQGFKLHLHPDLAKFNTLDYLLSQEFMLTTVGTHANHTAKKATKNPNDLVEEAARYVGQHKRNVSCTAAKQSYQQGLINGVLNQYRVAVIKDIKAPTFNPMGDEDSAKPFDGATYVSPESVYLENNSLGGASVGVDKKPFVHFYKAETASGGIVKTAGFALTNFGISNSKFYQNMVKKMWSSEWLDKENNSKTYDITKDFYGNTIQYEPIYYKDVFGKFYRVDKITNKSMELNGEIIPGNTYIINETEVDLNGDPVINTETGTTNVRERETKPIKTNYSLYTEVFGGWNSYVLDKLHSNDRGETLVPSEASIRNMVKAVNQVGDLKDGVIKARIQNDVFQPLKHASIQYVITAGAIKQGAANVNSTDAYYDDKPYLTMLFKTNDIGIQLDAEHEADEGTISLMTQVVNALASRGFTGDLADEVYSAMYSLTESAIDTYIKGFNKYMSTGDKTEFKDAVVMTIIDAIKRSTPRDGNLMQAIMDKLIIESKTGKLIKFKDVEGKIPFSDAGMFSLLSSSISSALTKIAIRLKFNGSLAVINPSHSVWKLYGDRLLGSFNNDDEIQNLQDLEYTNKKYTNASEIQLGRYYDFQIKGIEYKQQFIETPKQYWYWKKRMESDPKSSFNENITPGRDLACYNFTFKSVEGDEYDSEGNLINSKDVIYNMWDLDIIHRLYGEEDPKLEELNNPNINYIRPGSKKQLRRELQATLFAISKSSKENKPFSVNVRVYNTDGTYFVKSVLIKPNSLDIKPFELIMPKIYATRFGLSVGDDLNTISNDNLFFFKKLLRKWSPKITDYNNYHIELKRLDGNHTYLLDNRFANNANLKESKDFHKLWFKNKLYRVNSKGEKLYRLGSEKDKVYKDAAGNEVIVTDNTQFYIDSIDSYAIMVSDSAVKNKHMKKILAPIYASDKKVAKRLVKYIGKSDPLDIITYINQRESKAINNALKSPEIITEDPRIEWMREAGLEIYTSFIKSLDVLAARIPAQSMQSFMPMKVVGFDETDKNSAYVNYFQFWLQGSDLDIDKVSLLGFKFSKSGKFIGWSPHFNLSSVENLRASEKLPFPNNKELELVETEDTSLTNWANDFLGSGKLFNFESPDGGKITPDSNLIFLPDYTTDPSKENPIITLGKFLRMVSKNGNKLYIPKGTNLPFNKIKEVVDKHNLYVKNSTHPESMIENFIATYMFLISADPVNIMQSQAAIDDVTKELKGLASNSIEGQRNLQFTPGNSANKYESMYDAQSGKKNVGIVASAIKVFDGLTDYYNGVLRGLDENHIANLIFSQDICGHKYNMLANAYCENIQDIQNDAIRQILESVNNDDDAKLTFSALMTAATDNAKDPLLAKVNAGPEMMGLYTYGTSIGIPLKDLAGAMMSKTAIIISHLMQSNVFNGKDKTSINSALKLMEKGFDTKFLSTDFNIAVSSALGLVTFDEYELLRNINGILMIDTKDITNYNRNNQRRSDFFEKVNNAIYMYNMPNGASKAELYRKLEQMKEFSRNYEVVSSEMVTNSYGEVYTPLYTLRRLSRGASEMGRLRAVYALNQGLPNKFIDKLKFVNDFNSVFEGRIAELSKEERSESVLYNGNMVERNAVISELEQLCGGSHKISLIDFVRNEEYRTKLINIYGALKHTFNVLDAAWSVEHYRGYLLTFAMDWEGIRTVSSKVRFISKESPRLIDEGGYFSSKDKLNMYRKLQSFADIIMRNSWMKTSRKIITVPPAVDIMTNSGTIITTKANTPILLGTNAGNESFKMWMDSVVIPELKRTQPNKFIQNLRMHKLKRTLTGNASKVYALPINMMPKSETDKALLIDYVRAFNKLQSETYNGYPLIDLFYYYNLINFNGASSQSSFNPLFEDIIRTESSPLINDFHKYEADLDAHSDLIEGTDYKREDIIKWCAPFESSYASNKTFIRTYDGSDMKYHLFRIKKKETDIDGNPDNEYENEQEDEYMNDIMGDEEGQPIDVSGVNKQKYQLVAEVMGFTNPWIVSDINSSNIIRISPTITIEKVKENDKYIVNSIKLDDITYDRNEIIKALEGNDLEIPTMPLIIGDITKTIINTESLAAKINGIFNNPC